MQRIETWPFSWEFDFFRQVDGDHSEMLRKLAKCFFGAPRAALEEPAVLEVDQAEFSAPTRKVL